MVDLDLQKLLDGLQTFIAVLDRDGRVVFINNTAVAAGNKHPSDVLGRYFWDCFWFNHSREVRISIEKLCKRSLMGISVMQEIELSLNGELVWIDFSIHPVSNKDGKIIQIVPEGRIITDKKIAEAVIFNHAHYDVLTGLPNRRMLYDKLLCELNRHNKDNFFGLFILDLDKFKDINDNFGHEYGDILLQKISKRIINCVRHSDVVARLGGDEFAIILTELHSNIDVEEIASKIIMRLQEPFELKGKVVYLSASLGITLAPFDGNEIDVLFSNADKAMYHAKKNGRNQYRFFTESLQNEIDKRLALIDDLRAALENNEFEAYYQPIVDLKSGMICKAEALIRWNHPIRGMVSPLEFIPLAEETGIINEIGNWMLKEASKQAKIFLDKYNENFQISINISPVQFMEDTHKVTQEYKNFLDKHHVSSKNIVMEITENILLDVDARVRDKLFWLKENGIEIAIDDFGTGYSSLSYLKKFNVDYLKIDKVFIENIEENKDDYCICEAMILMAHTIGLKVIAEGIETDAQRDILSDMKCDFGQGYLFSRPVLPKDFGEKIMG